MVIFDHDGLSNTEDRSQFENLKFSKTSKYFQNLSKNDLNDDGRGLKLKFHRFFNR